MATWNIKTTGTKVSGASTADDWTDANCYASLGAIDDSVLAGGDSIVFNDETHTISSTVTLNSMPTAGTISWSSRGGSARYCVLSLAVLDSCSILINNNTAAQAHTFSNITFTVSGTHVGAATRRSATIQFSNAVGNVTFTSCVFRDITADWSSTTSGVEGCLMDYAVASSGTKTLLFDTCTFLNISLTGPAAGGISAINGRTGCSFLKFQDCTFKNWTIAYAGSTHGVFRSQSGTLQALRCTVDGFTVTGTNWDGFFFQNTANTTASFRRVAFKNGVLTGTAHPACIKCAQPFYCEDLSGENITFNNSDSTAGIGGVFLAQNTTGIGRLHGLRAFNVQQNYGAGCYFSNFAGGVITDVYTTQCRAVLGAGIYIGGSTNTVSISRSWIVQSQQILDGTGDGAALYIHQKNDATAARTVTLYDVHVLDSAPLGSGTYPINISAQSTSHALTATLYKCSARNPLFTTGEIRAHALTGCTLTYVATDCNVDGGAGAIDEVGSGTLSGTVSGTTDATIFYQPSVSSVDARPFVVSRGGA